MSSIDPHAHSRGQSSSSEEDLNLSDPKEWTTTQQQRATPRKLIYTLIGCACFFAVLAALIPTWVTHSLHKIPLDMQASAVARGEGEVLDRSSLMSSRLRTEKNVPLEYLRSLSVKEPSDSENVTLQIGAAIMRTDKDVERERLVGAYIQRVSVDRRTAFPIDGVNGSFSSEAGQPSQPVLHDGYTVLWPLGSEKKTYPFFDPIARKSFPIDFVGESERDGMPVYEYRHKITGYDLSKVSDSNEMRLPGTAFGLTTANPITVSLYYDMTRSYFVEPTTGAVVDAFEDTHQYLGRKRGDELVSVFKLAASVDEDTVRSQVSSVKDALRMLDILQLWLPIGLGVAALGCAAAATVLFRRSARR